MVALSTHAHRRSGHGHSGHRHSGQGHSNRGRASHRRAGPGLLLRLALLALILSTPGIARAASDRSRTAAPTVTLTYGYWDANQEPALHEIADAFTKAHPSIEVRLENIPFPDYWTKLLSATSPTEVPDVYWMNGPNFPLFASRGMLLPLNYRIERARMNLKVYPKGLVNLYTYRGHHYALPRDFDVVGLWYNKQLFRAAHVSYPTSAWRWSDFFAAAKRLTNHKKGIWGFVAEMKDQEGYYNTIPQAGGFVISKDKRSSGYDDPRTIKGLQFWMDALQMHVSPPASQMTQTDIKNTLFEKGKAAMIFGGDWLAGVFDKVPYTKKRADVAVLPAGVKRATVIHGLGNVISAGTAHPDEAWEFLQFLGSRQAALILAETGTVIPAYNDTQNHWVRSIPQYHLSNMIAELPYAVPYPVSQDTAEWNALEHTYFSRAWAGKMSIVTAARTVARKMNAILLREREH